MTIKVKRKDLNNPTLNEAMRRLAQHPFEFKVSYNISRLIRQIDSIMRRCDEEYKNMVDQFFLKDDDGNKVPAMTKEVTNDKGEVIAKSEPIPNQYKLVENGKEKMTEFMDKFMDIEEELKSYPLSLDDLEKVSIAPTDIIAIEPFIAGEQDDKDI